MQAVAVVAEMSQQAVEVRGVAALDRSLQTRCQQTELQILAVAAAVRVVLDNQQVSILPTALKAVPAS